MNHPPPYDRDSVINAQLWEAAEEVYRAYNRELEKLTKQQFVEVLRQALASGDFMRHVLTGGGQRVTYLPYRRVDELEAKVKELEEALENAGIARLEEAGE